MKKFLIIILLLVITITSSGQIISGVVASSLRGSTSNVPRNGLIAYYKCDESSGNLVDSYGSYTGTATGLTYGVSGAINTAETYNGTSSNVAIGTGIRPTTGLSVSFWIKANTQSAEKLLICNTAWNTSWYGWRLSMTVGGSIEVLMCNGTDTQMLDIIDGADALDDNTLHHIVLTWNGTTTYTYHDNNKSAGNAWAYTLTYIAACNLHFGSNEEENSSFYAGLLDEIAIYNRALTDSEVTLLFNKSPF